MHRRRRRAIIVDPYPHAERGDGELEFLSLENVDSSPYSDMFTATAVSTRILSGRRSVRRMRTFAGYQPCLQFSPWPWGWMCWEYIRRLPLGSS